MPHRVLITDRLRMPPGTGHLTGETRKGDAINTLFDQMPEDTLMCLTMVATPQDVLEADLNHLAKKAVGETLASEQTLKDVQEARSLIGSAHKLRSEEHTSELQSLMRNSYAVFCLKKTKQTTKTHKPSYNN